MKHRTAAAAAAALTLALGFGTLATGPAQADPSGDKDPYAPSSGGDEIGAGAQGIDYDYSPNSGSTPMTSSNPNWSPPPCWFAPKYTNESLDKHNEKLHEDPTSGVSGEVLERRKKETAAHKGEDGHWWERTPVMSPRSCQIGELWIWVPDGDPDPPEGAIDPEILAGKAYEHTKLPKPPVELKPSGARQKVNLPTHVTFGQQLDRVWTTARVDVPEADLHIAATTVAVPHQLKIDAGTGNASPRTCTYDLAESGGSYKVDTAGADCNITYRRDSKGGTYPLSAQIVWEVTWTATDDPDGPKEDTPPLPDGTSVYNQDVTVKEVQTVVR